MTGSSAVREEAGSRRQVPSGPRAGGRRWHAELQRVRPVALPLAALALAGAGWQMVVSLTGVPSYLLPSPGQVWQSLLDHKGVLAANAAVTLHEALIGFACALVFGFGISVLMSLSRIVYEAVHPLVVLTQVVPTVAIAPLVVLYLGFGIESKVFLAFLIAFFPVVINASLGLNAMAPELLELMASLGATRWQVMVKVRLRRALPYVAEGAKITITLAVIGAIVGELDSGAAGLGFLIKFASSEVNTSLAFAALLVLVLMGITLFEIVDIAGRKLIPSHARKPELGRQ